MRGAATALVVVAVTSADAAAQVLEPYYTPIPVDVIDPSYRPHANITTSVDLDGDGNQDLVLLGWTFPTSDVTAANYRPQPGRVFLGDGDGGFRRAPAELFPVDTLNTVNPSCCPQFGDLNGDELPDMFLPLGGWDAEPFPGEQNRLYLSRPGGGWRDATSELPPLSDFTHSAAVGDIRGLGTPDILVGNIWGGDHVLPYMLLNNGDETFSLDRSNLPVGPDETLNFRSRTLVFTGTVLTDLDGDGLPDLIALGEGYEGHLAIEAVSFVFRNRAGAFSEQHKTPLPSPEAFAHGLIALDAAALDADGDGLLDLVVVGTQLNPFYDGWFVQLLMNRGDGTFTDETALRLRSHEQSSGNAGVAANAPWARWVDVLDFNGDGAADFVMATHGDDLPPDQPLIWLNDGSGRFSALKVHDFVRTGDEWLLYGARLVRTRHGYSYINMHSFPGSGGLTLTGLLATRPYRERLPSANRPPTAVGALPNRDMVPGGTLGLDVAQVFVDPDGDQMTYMVSSSAPQVVAAHASGARVTLTAASEGAATIRVTATDPGGLVATQAFTVTVSRMVRGSFTDPIQPGVTPVKAVHFTELRTRIDALRSAAGLLRFSWTDPVLLAGVTRVRRVHLLELRSALAEAYRAAGRAAPRWTDAAPASGSIPIRGLHVTELRAAVLALE